MLGPKDSIVYYNDGEPNNSLQGKCDITIHNYQIDILRVIDLCLGVINSLLLYYLL